MKIGVTAATGKLGKEIVYALRDEIGAENTIGLARRPERNQIKDVEFRKGDYNNKRELLEGFHDLDVVILIASNDDPKKRLQQHQNVIDAAIDAQVKRLIYVSILGSEERTTFNEVVKSNRQTEEYLINSGITYTIGRNSLYIEPDLEYIDHYISEGKICNSAGAGRCTYTSRCELAIAYAKLATQSGHENIVYNLGGESITQHELVMAINEAYGSNLFYEYVSAEKYSEERIEVLGDFLGTIISGIYQSIQLGDFDVYSEFEEIVGRKHKSVQEMIEHYRKWQYIRTSN